MKYLKQILIIMLFVFLGEVLGYFIPLPIAGSIYGLILLFAALCFGIVKLEWVADVADWLHSIMGLFFIAPMVAVIDIWVDIGYSVSGCVFSHDGHNRYYRRLFHKQTQF